MNDTFGHTLGTPLTRYDPDTQSWRTCQDTSLWDLEMSLPTLPQSGSMRNGELFERQMLARPTDVNGYSSLPTPHAGLGERGRDGVYPNPKGQQDLQHALAHLLPTPAVMDMGSNYTPQEWEAWKAKQRAVHNNGNGHGASLTQEALNMLPTPKARDYKDESLPPRITKENWQGGAQLPREIAMLPTPNTMDSLPAREGEAYERVLHRGGESSRRKTSGNLREVVVHSLLPNGENTPPQSNAGNTSLDDRHQPQLFNEMTGSD